MSDYLCYKDKIGIRETNLSCGHSMNIAINGTMCCLLIN